MRGEHVTAARKGAVKPKRTARQANGIDVHVGQRMRVRRVELGKSQEQLAAELGLTFQQVQKYEHGVNRVSASRLFELARVLDVPIMWFFEALDPKQGQRASERRSDTASDEAMARRETLALVHVYYQIEDPKLRRKLYEMAKALAAQ